MSEPYVVKDGFMKFIRFLIFSMVAVSAAWATTVTGAPPGPRIFNWQKAYFFNFYDVCPLPNGDVWVVGSKGMVCAYIKDTHQWVIQESHFSRNLYCVRFPAAEKGWIVGQNGTILHTNNKGKTWVKQNNDSTEHLFGVSFTDEETGWAVGAYGTILHTSNGGEYWYPQGEQVDRIHNDVFFIDHHLGWVVGEFGVILHTKNGGKTWEEQESPYGEKTLFSVFFSDKRTGYASGMDGVLIHTQDGGTTWSPIDAGITENLFSVTAYQDRQWAVGLKGTYAKQDNGSWQNATEKVPTRAWLKKCAFLDEKSGWIVGSVGTVLFTTDGGNTWVPAGQFGVK